MVIDAKRAKEISEQIRQKNYAKGLIAKRKWDEECRKFAERELPFRLMLIEKEIEKKVGQGDSMTQVEYNINDGQRTWMLVLRIIEELKNRGFKIKTEKWKPMYFDTVVCIKIYWS